MVRPAGEGATQDRVGKRGALALVALTVALALVGCDASRTGPTEDEGNPVQTGFPGDPAAPGFAAPAPVASNQRFTDLDLGRSSACAVATTGDVYCWGTTGSNIPARADAG